MPMVVQMLRELPTMAILFFVRSAKSLWLFSRLWQLAQRLFGRCHIAADTAQYANGLQAES
jgi:hypothetical protein